MKSAQQHMCDLDGGRPAPHSVICNQCVEDLTDELEQFRLKLLGRFKAIAYGL